MLTLVGVETVENVEKKGQIFVVAIIGQSIAEQNAHWFVASTILLRCTHHKTDQVLHLAAAVRMKTTERKAPSFER